MIDKNSKTFLFLKEWNKILLESKKVNDIWYIGLKHNITNSEKFELLNKKINSDEVLELINFDINNIEILKKVKLEEHQKTALISLYIDLDYIPKSIELLLTKRQPQTLKNKWLSLYKNNKEYIKRLAELDMFNNKYKGKEYYKQIKINV